MSEVVRHYKEIKKALKKDPIVNTFTLGKYSISPYRACQHGCKYCDGRAEKYYVEGNFETDIIIRNNLPELLANELPKLKERGIISFASGVTDVYQPSEAKERLMQQSANLLLMHDYPVSVMTKSSLILRDIDLWKQVHEKTGFILMVSLTFLDDDLRRIFEPGASSVEKRLKMIAEFKNKGMYVGVLAMPFIPFISDSYEQICALMQKLKEIGVDFMMPGGLTLRPGKQKDLFLHTIEMKFPHLLAKIKGLYQEDRPSGNPLPAYTRQLTDRFKQALENFPIPSAPPHELYRNLMPLQDEIYVLMSHMADLYSRKGINVYALRQSLNKYAAWLTAEKKTNSRKSKSFVQEAIGKIDSSIISGELEHVIQNDKLFRFIMKVAVENKNFDYVNLKLI